MLRASKTKKWVNPTLDIYLHRVLQRSISHSSLLLSNLCSSLISSLPLYLTLVVLLFSEVEPSKMTSHPLCYQASMATSMEIRMLVDLNCKVPTSNALAVQ